MINGVYNGIKFEIRDGEVKCNDDRLKKELEDLIDFVCLNQQPYQGDAEYKISELLDGSGFSVEYKNTEPDLVY